MWIVETVINGTSITKVIQQRHQTNSNQGDQSPAPIPFTIGRREGDLIYCDDRRVSRTHAQIQIILNESDPNQRPKLFLTDLSRFGTTINGQRVTADAQHALSDNDSICVGLSKSTFTVKWKTFNVVSSGITSAEKKRLKLMVSRMGGSFFNQWTDTATHLVVPQQNVKITIKLISAVISDHTEFVTIPWLQHIATNSIIPTPSSNLLPSTLTNWLQIGRRNETESGISRCKLFDRKLLIFIDSKLMQNHKSIIERCSGLAMLCKTRTKTEIEDNVRNRDDVDWFTVIDDTDNKLIGGSYPQCKSPSIANAILSCTAKGSNAEIPWIAIDEIKKEKEDEQKCPISPPLEPERGGDDVFDILMDSVSDQKSPEHPLRVKEEEKKESPSSSSSSSSLTKKKNLKRKRDDIESTESVPDRVVVDPLTSPPMKRRKSMGKTESVSPAPQQQQSPRKLNSSHFVSIKKWKSQKEASSQCTTTTMTTNAIHRTLSLMVERDKKSGKNGVKPLYFKDLSGRKRLREENDGEDHDGDEAQMLQQQLELYSEQNIAKLQGEVIEMDIVQRKRTESVINDGSGQSMNQSVHSMYSSMSRHQIPSAALEQPNFKRFRGNKNYIRESTMRNLVEFDTDFGNEANYGQAVDQEFDGTVFKKQLEKEEQEEKVMDKLFVSKKRAKRVASPKKTQEKKRSVVGRKRNRNQIECDDKVITSLPIRRSTRSRRQRA